MRRSIAHLSADERVSCARAGQDALDAVLARLSEVEQADIRRSIRCGYVQPTTGAATKNADPAQAEVRARA
jgi:hypothetical protein